MLAKRSAIQIILFLILLTQSVGLVAQTTVSFKIKNFGINVKGHFEEVAIDTEINLNQLDKSYINATIKTKSINTGMESRDRHLRNEDFFDVVSHPEIQFNSEKIILVSENSYRLFGKLQMKGVVKDIEIPLTVQKEQGQLFLNARFSINRKEYGVGKGSLILSKKVNIDVRYSKKLK